MSKHPVNPKELAAPIGFSHGWVVEQAGSKTLYLAGQCGYGRDGRVESPGDLTAQLDRALANIGLVLAEVGMAFADVVQLNFYVTSRNDYAMAREMFGKIWQRHCGRHYPAMAMFEVGSLLDADALIEVQGVAAR